MNFMPGRQGFYEEIITSNRGMSSSSSSSTTPSTSSSSSLQHPLYTYHHGVVAASQNPTNNDVVDNNNNDSDDHMFPRARGGGGGGGEGTSTGSASMAIEREHMFDKIVTPSDVGKLNRLVIPKQHAEKYFPLDSSTNEKGLLLNFEDRNGKPWRFRYSYWNSSQSYVMTKGWSRFVKEKKLDAGDIVSFQRGVGEANKDRLFIDWRRRPDAPDPMAHIPTLSFPHQFSFQRTGTGGTTIHHHHPWSHNPLFLSRDYSHQLLHSSSNATTSAHHHYQNHGGYGGVAYGGGYSNVVNGNPCPPGSLVYLRSGGGLYAPQQQQQQVGVVHAQAQALALAQQRGGERMVYESVPVVQGKAAAKRLRLFGVNMDCPISNSSDSSPDHRECDADNSTTLPLIHQIHQYQYQYPPNFEHQLSSSDPSASAVPSLQLGRNYNQGDDNDDDDEDDDEDKGKGSMSLDLDI